MLVVDVVLMVLLFKRCKCARESQTKVVVDVPIVLIMVDVWHPDSLCKAEDDLCNIRRVCIDIAVKVAQLERYVGCRGDG